MNKLENNDPIKIRSSSLIGENLNFENISTFCNFLKKIGI